MFQHEYEVVHYTRRSKNETDKTQFVKLLAFRNSQFFCEYTKISKWNNERKRIFRFSYYSVAENQDKGFFDKVKDIFE